MDLLIPSFGLIIWTLLAFLIVFFHSQKVCMETDPEFFTTKGNFNSRFPFNS
jgi:hypothetical protein